MISHSRGMICPSFAKNVLLSEIRGRRECRALDAPVASRAEKGRKHTSSSHHGHTGNTRHSPRNGFNKLLRALPGEPGLFATVASGYRFRRLDTSVGVSGPHDFAVRKTAPFVSALPTSIASRPASGALAS